MRKRRRVKLPVDPRFRGATPRRLALALRNPKKPKTTEEDNNYDDEAK